MQLQRKLFWTLSLLTVAPLLVLQFGVVDRNAALLEDRVRRTVLTSLDKLAGEMAALLNSQKSLVRGLSAVPAVGEFVQAMERPGADADYRSRARELGEFFLNYQAAVPSIQALRILDSDGNTLVKVKENKIIEPGRTLSDGRPYVANQGSKPFFKLARRLVPGTVSVSDFELGQLTPQADFCPSMVRYLGPLAGSDGVNSYLVVNVWGTRIDELISAALADYGGSAAMAELSPSNPERDGVYLFHPDVAKRFGNQTGSDERMSVEVGPDQWQRIVDGPVEGHVQLGDRMIFYRKFRPFTDRDTEWLLMVDRERSEFLQPVLAVRNTIWALLAGVILLGLVLAGWSARRLARPVEHLVDTITRYADGESVRYKEKRGDEIGRVGHAFNYLCDSLEAAESDREQAEALACQAARMATVGELAAGVAHELNNPLNNMMGLVELMQGDQLPAAARDDLNVLRQECRRCADIVEGLLNFSRPKQPALRVMDLGMVAADSVRLLTRKAQTKNLSLRLIEDCEDCTLEADPGQMQQVMVNLLLNAIHASPEGAVIQLLIRRSGGRLVCQVEDRGEGVTEGELGRIFEPFYTSRKDKQGTGLGLSVSYSIIQHHGGEMGARRRRQGGLCVWFSMRAVASEVAVPPRTNEIESAPSS